MEMGDLIQEDWQFWFHLFREAHASNSIETPRFAICLWNLLCVKRS